MELCSSVSAEARVYYSWSTQLTDFFVLEEVAHTPCPLIPGGCRGDLFAAEDMRKGLQELM